MISLRCGVCAAAGVAAVASAATTNARASRMSLSFAFEARDDAGRARVVALAHFVDERDGVFEQRELRLEALEQTLLRGRTGGLHAQRGPAFADRLIDDRQVLLHRRGGLRVERALLAVGDRFEALDRLLVVR